MPVQIGTSLPITEFGPDLNAVMDFAQAADDLGYKILSMLDHVLGADPQYHPEVANFYYTHESYIHEPFTLMGYLAAITNNITMGTSIMILAQRQTSLVAKQAAEVDVLSGGRIRLGIGVGWNPVEYEALGGGLPHPWQEVRRANRGPAPAVDPGEGKLRRPLPHDNRGRHQPLAGAEAHSSVDRPRKPP